MVCYCQLYFGPRNITIKDLTCRSIRVHDDYIIPLSSIIFKKMGVHNYRRSFVCYTDGFMVAKARMSWDRVVSLTGQSPSRVWLPCLEPSRSWKGQEGRTLKMCKNVLAVLQQYTGTTTMRICWTLLISAMHSRNAGYMLDSGCCTESFTSYDPISHAEATLIQTMREQSAKSMLTPTGARGPCPICSPTLLFYSLVPHCGTP